MNLCVGACFYMFGWMGEAVHAWILDKGSSKFRQIRDILAVDLIGRNAIEKCLAEMSFR